MREKLLIATGAVGVTLFLFLLAYLANMYGQLKTTGLYVPPQDLVDFIKFVLGASVSVLTLGSMPSVRKLIGIEAKDEQQKQDYKVVCAKCDQSICVCDIREGINLIRDDLRRSGNHESDNDPK